MADGKGCRCAAHSESECGCGVDWTPQELIDARAEITRLRAELADTSQSFKNFHRRLCERFGYHHDEKDWRRDQLSLELWISSQLAEAKRHAKVLADAMSEEVLDGYPSDGDGSREWISTSCWMYPDEMIVNVRHTDSVKAALKWAKEQA